MYALTEAFLAQTDTEHAEPSTYLSRRDSLEQLDPYQAAGQVLEGQSLNPKSKLLLAVVVSYQPQDPVIQGGATLCPMVDTLFSSTSSPSSQASPR